MSASQIPNLLSGPGRGSNTRGRGRGRGRTTPNPPLSNTERASLADIAIQSTDTDAAISRMSAVALGYLEDAYAAAFLGGGSGGSGGGDESTSGGRRGTGRPDVSQTRRLPIINRGTYVRTKAVDRLVDGFLSGVEESSVVIDSAETHRKDVVRRQIISLGAGSDTRYWRLREQGKHHGLLYHEIDFPQVCEQKRRTVESSSLLLGDQSLSILPAVDPPEADAPNATAAAPRPWCLRGSSTSQDDTPQYICHPLDLRRLDRSFSSSSSASSSAHAASTSDSPQPIAIPYLHPSIPTLLISECCLCYLRTYSASAVISYFTSRISRLGIVLYEPVGADDAFGQMMVENLAARGIVMPTVQQYQTLRDQMSRLRDAGFGSEATGEPRARRLMPTGDNGIDAIDVERAWETWTSTQEKERIDALEGLDEVEEWQLLARHYAIVYGWKEGG